MGEKNEVPGNIKEKRRRKRGGGEKDKRYLQKETSYAGSLTMPLGKGKRK